MLSFFRQGQAASATGDQAHFGPTLERRQPLADNAQSKAHFPAGRGQAPRRHDPNEGAKFGDIVEHAATLLSVGWRVTPFRGGYYTEWAGAKYLASPLMGGG